MKELLRVPVFLFAVLIFARFLHPIFQSISLRLSGRRFCFVIGRKQVRTSRDVFDFIWSAILFLLAFCVGGTVLALLIMLQWL